MPAVLFVCLPVDRIRAKVYFLLKESNVYSLIQRVSRDEAFVGSKALQNAR